MKVTLAQLNFKIADFEGNFIKISQAIKKAKKDGTHLIVFSELSVCGYPPQDLLEHQFFVEQCEKYIKKTAELCRDIAAIIGGPSLNPNPGGKMLYNTAFFCANGKVEALVHKSLLPTYDVFDEYRYFEPNTGFSVVHYMGKKLGITICEDLWYDQPIRHEFKKGRLYNFSPMEKLSDYSPDLIINIAASPFSANQEEIKQTILVDNARRYKVPIIYLNQVGANTELIFDGGSMILNREGETVCKLTHFTEDLRSVDTSELEFQGEIVPSISKENRIRAIHDAIILGIRDYFNKLGFSKATLGLSGGMDSAVSVVLASRALGAENIHALLMPSKYSSDHSVRDAEELAGNLGISYHIISIEDLVSTFDKTLDPLFKGLDPDIAEENIQARIRGVLLMALSNKLGMILLNTSNKSETAVGYGTLYGDMAGGLSVLGDVYKTDVYQLARFINREKEIIPENIFIKPPSAELRPDQKDTDSLPEYEILDQILLHYIENQYSVTEIAKLGFEKDLVQKILRLVNLNEYKRYQAPPILRISSKAFGIGRRMPLVAKY